MKYFSLVFRFLYENRRIVGLITGSAFVLAGYDDVGNAIITNNL